MSILEDAPFADPAGFAQRLVQEAGDGGAVVLDYTGPIVTPLLQAIEQQGLIDSVIWASSTPPNDPSVAEALGPAWNGKFLINAEFNVLDSGKPDQNHMNEVREQYAPDVNSSSFAQMGYLAGRVATDALLGHRGRDHQGERQRGVQERQELHQRHLVQAVVLRQQAPARTSPTTPTSPWRRWTATMVQVEDCFEIAELPDNPLAEIRAAEQELGLNTAG